MNSLTKNRLTARRESASFLPLFSILWVCLLLQNARATLFTAEVFDYPAGNLSTAAPWSGAGSNLKMISGDLSYDGLAGPASSPTNITKAEGLASAADGKRTFNATAVGSPSNAASIYVSFLLRQTTLAAGSGPLLAISDSTTVGSSGVGALVVYLNKSGSEYQLGVKKNGSAVQYPAGGTYAVSNTVLVVARYKFNTSSTTDDTVTLWINPVLNGVEPAPGTSGIAETTVSGAADYAVGLQYVHLRANSSTASGVNEVDLIRVGDSWADVTPTGVVAPVTAPYVTQTILSPNGLVLRGTNGTSNGVFRVLASADLALPWNQWSEIATNSFDVNGNFDCTNPISPADAKKFFRLLTGGQLAPPAVGPAFTLQPTNLTVIAGQPANFYSAVSGTAPLSYQWFFNTNSPLSGATSFNYTVASVTTNDAGNYSVRVTNSAGSILSTQATLTVLVPPSVTTQPSNFTANAGQNAAFYAAASGSAPLSYQWFVNTNTPLASATSASLTLTNVQTTNAGSYSLRVTNAAGSVTSAVVTLTVNGPPAITTQPQSQSVTVSNNATFTVIATGTTPLSYQWFFNTNTPVSNATNASLTITNATTTNAGSYRVIITNNYGAATSVLATLTVNAASSNTPNFGLFGFGQATTGGGVIPETDSAYAKVYTPLDLANAIVSANKTAGSIKVIEIMNDLDLGWNEIGTNVQNLGSTPFREPSNLPLLHPGLISAGFTLCDIKPKSGLTIFSANGSTIRHCNFNIKSCNNIIVRNLKFDENWEWDEATKGNYDRNDYDFITIANGGDVTNVWIDHCTFTKSYDGVVDQKAGTVNVTFSWNKYVGDDGATNPNSWVRQQINALESNKSAYAFYNFLRTHGYSVENIVQIIQAHDKTHLAGANSLDSANATLAMTFHHQLVLGVWDRCMPRLRAGNAHNYNLYVDDSNVLAARRLRDTIAAAMSSADQNTLNNTYSFNPPINGSISTEGGAVLVEKSVYSDCLWPLRNNQTDPTDPTYTGKIMAVDSIYHFDNADGSTVDYRGSSTNAPGSTYFGPQQAAVIPFSWNLPGTQLPYSYTADDPSQIQSMLTAYAGAGALTWAKTNWLKTSY